MCVNTFLGCYMINTRALDPKESRNRFRNILGMFRHHFQQTEIWTPKTLENGHFGRNFCIEHVCLCVHILFSGRDTIRTGNLDPKEYVNRLWGISRKFEGVFSWLSFWAPKKAPKRPFLEILKSKMCACVCTYLFWGAWRSEQVPLPPKCLWKKTWVLNSNLNPL